MRVGTNPLRVSSAPAQIQPVVLACIVHLPNQVGYHAKRMEVVKTCLHSLKYNAGINASIAVWDNGSIPELANWIDTFIKPDIFIRSGNIGKNNASKMLFSMLPPQTLVSCSDDDMYHEPHWIKPQIDLFNHFPNVAAVSGYVVRTAFRWGCEFTKEWAIKNAKLRAYRAIPDKYEQDFCDSIGRDYAMHKEKTKNELDYVISYKGVDAYATSHHCQILGRAGILAECMEYDGQSMGGEQGFDIALDRVGLRLGTMARLTRHMGNVIDDKLRDEINVVK